MLSLEEVLTESKKTAEFSFLNTYLVAGSRMFIQIKQLSIVYNGVMSVLVTAKDVTQILNSRSLEQQNSELKNMQLALVEKVSNPTSQILKSDDFKEMTKEKYGARVGNQLRLLQNTLLDVTDYIQISNKCFVKQLSYGRPK